MPDKTIRSRSRFAALHRLLTGQRGFGPRNLPATDRLRRDMGMPPVQTRLRPSTFSPHGLAFRQGS
ncbi:hypothetical protein VK792_17870 [Mesobacterium sp. TK19101]|uniref:Uncharacterized protein n=1 Tax=Mesobacterium hydrothermale TaxID=3111907 RepID=A0ABU6HPK6_9RHOB|nr:hypothetical protein [Mesobacterium sp. TK19101]MEC3863165.1 hypothetical protein [Mesobacterium sp. TK19101]